MRLASRLDVIDASGIRKIFDLARSMTNPINLSIGQPDFDVPEAIKEAAIEAIRQGPNSYTPTQGRADLVAQFRDTEQAYTGRKLNDDQVLVTSGVSGGLFLALLALVEPGDEVLIPDPYFVMYKHLVRLFGGVPVYVDTYASDFTLTAEAVAQHCTAKTSLLLLNSPANPTGRIIPREELQRIAQVAQQQDLMVISDEIYRDFAYLDCPSISTWLPEAIVLGGLSKSYGMTGWRLGYAAGPSTAIQAMAKLQQYSFVCAPSMVQAAALACPQVDMTSAIADYQAKRDLMVSLLSPGFEVAPADGAFYCWVKAPGESGTAFVERAIAANVLIIPGGIFSEQDTHFRVCYTVPNDQLQAGAQTLLRLAAEI